MDDEIKPLPYCCQPPHPQSSMLSLGSALGTGGQKNQTLNTEEARVLFNIEIWGVGFYLVDACRVFCPSTVGPCWTRRNSFVIFCGVNHCWIKSWVTFWAVYHPRVNLSEREMFGDAQQQWLILWVQLSDDWGRHKTNALEAATCFQISFLTDRTW
jgi:hypothetical protein